MAIVCLALRSKKIEARRISEPKHQRSRLSTQSRSDDTFHHLFEGDTSGSAQEARQALLSVLGHHVDLDVDCVAWLLASDDNLLLGVANEHNLPPTLLVVHLGNCQAGAVKRNIALVDNVAQNSRITWSKAESQGVTVRRDGQDGGSGVDVSLDEVAAHAGVGADGSLEVDARVLRQRTQVGDAECLGGDADLEVGRRGLELSHRQADAIDGDGVAEVAVCEEIGGLR